MSHKTTVGWPVYSLTFTPSDQLLIGGGGGSTKAGLKNTAGLFSISKLRMEQISEHLFGSDEDGCMCLAVHPIDQTFAAGVNQSQANVHAGQNLNCRLFLIKDEKIKFSCSINTCPSLDSFNYMKVVKFSPDGKYMVTGSTDGQLNVFAYPALTHVFPPKNYKQEIYDIDIDPKSLQIAVLTNTAVHVIDILKNKVRWSIERANYRGGLCDYRAVRFFETHVYVVVNTKDRKFGLVYKYKEQVHTDSWIISNKPITCFATNGTILAFATSDLQVLIYNGKMKRILALKECHGFPATAISLNETGTMIASGSADGTVMVARVSSGSLRPIPFFALLIAAILAALIAILLSRTGDVQQEL